MRRGDFRFLVLMTLSEKPMHGYALIQEIGRTFQRPVSAGLVYPTLQELEEGGYVSCTELDGKKTYQLTASGVTHLEENAQVVGRLKDSKAFAERVNRLGFMRDITEMQALAIANEAEITEEKASRIQELLTDARKRMATVIFE